MSPVKIIISARSVILFFAIVLLIWILYQARDVILLLFASFIIASALFPIVDSMNKKMPRGVAVLLIYLVSFLIVSTLFVPALIILTNQLQEFIKQIPAYIADLEKLTDHLRIMSKGSTLIPNFAMAFSSSSGLGENIINQSINITINLFTGIVAAFTMAVLVLFMILDKTDLKDGFLKFFPLEMREKTENIIVTISRKVGGYVRGQLLVMGFVGLFTSLGMYLIGVDFALLLGLLAGLLEIIPIIGPILSAVPAVIIALTHGPWFALWVIIVYLIIQRIENNIISPIILSKFLDMHPLIILSALLIAASTLGVIGVILAPPIAAAIYVLVQELYLNKINPEVID